ncbi:MAG: RNA 3'-terminal phosphate cyclase [Robiginitomaculum sp.]|nr:RNA 3'-terminal phosphate cyclase [Robiginitomaculum sp.]
MNKRIISIDGSEGEGGGQVLRTSISLSAITGIPVRIDNIRAGRRKPGLMRQHLTSIKAAAEICSAKTESLVLGAEEISFAPNTIEGGDYRFEIGSAGGTCLVAQTIIPILSHAKTASKVSITGGTHNLWAPTFDYLDRAFLPLFNQMGGQANIELVRHGFYPAGGGEITVSVKPSNETRALALTKRGEKTGASIVIVLANLKRDIANREIKSIMQRMNMDKSQAKILQVDGPGPGNVVTLAIEYENVTEIFVGLGQHGVRAEAVGNGVVDEARKYFTSDAAVDAYMADQLLLPMALFGGGVFTTSDITKHTRTNIEIIKRFLDVEIQTGQLERKLWEVTVSLPDY